MFGREGGDIGVGLGLGLLDEVHAAALIEPGGDEARKSAVACGGEHGDLAAAGLRVVLLHGGLARGELILDLAALVAADAGEFFVGVVELVGSELKLGLGDVEVVGVGDAAVGPLEGGGEGVHMGLIFFDHGLQLGDFLLDREGVAGEGVAAEGGLAKSQGEGLVDCVVGETLGLVGEGLLFGGDGERRERLDGLPGPLIDESVLARRAFALEEGHVGHGASGPPGRGEAEDEEHGGDRDCEAAKELHSSTLHGWRRGSKTPKV